MAGEKQAMKPVSRESRGFHDDRGGLSRDELEERDSLVASGAAYFPGGRNDFLFYFLKVTYLGGAYTL